MYFPSKKDLWLNLLIWLTLLIPLILVLIDFEWSGLLIVSAVLMFWSWLWFYTGYTITDSELRIKSGPFRWKIPLEAIRKVRRTRNPLSSPALSLDRLKIEDSKGGFVLISPDNMDSFLDVLSERCPQADIKRS